MKKEEQSFDFINLDETAEWSKLDVEEKLKNAEPGIHNAEENSDITKKKSVTKNSNVTNNRIKPADAMEYLDEGVEEYLDEDIEAEQDIPVKKATARKKTSAAHKTSKHTAAEHAVKKHATTKNVGAVHKAKKHTAVEPTVKKHKSTKKPVVKKVASKKTTGSNKKKRNQDEASWLDVMIYRLHKMTAMDMLVAGTGILVLCVAIVTLSIFTTAKAAEKQVEAMVPIGEKLELLGTAGEDTLLAVTDARRYMLPTEEEMSEEETYEEKEEDENGDVKVTMTLTSMKKDLKIKFLNSKTKKLIPNVGFEVEIKDADGKTYTKEDDDKDGIIYLKDMTPGDASVSLVASNGNDKLVYDSKAQKVTIKENLDYKKIDVSDEVKKESQVNAKVEDTAAQNAVEAALTDTVAWVESTRTEIGSNGGYSEVSKSSIAEPGKSAKAVGMFMKTTEVKTVSGSDLELTPSPTPTEPPKQDPVITPTSIPTNVPTSIPTTAPTPTTVPTVTPTKAVTPTPTANPAKSDTKTPLKDKSGNQLYVKDSSGNYVEAKYADYYKASTFYQKVANTQYKYTGWQDIDGKTYFFDANGNKITGEQVIQGAKYNFASDGALVTGSGTMGIDVSKWNGNINWTAVKNSGVSYVIIRCGYRGSTTGALIEDPKFKTNIAGAAKAGLKVGIYFFTQAVNEVEAVEEASMTIGLIKNYRISYPVFLDVESSGGRADGLDAGTRTQVINAYCQTIRNSGYTAGVYANKTWLSQKMNAGSLSSYKIWLAQYNTAPTYSGKIDLWQYTSKGSVGGISGNTDMNLSYLGY